MRDAEMVDTVLLGPRPKGALKPGKILAVFVTDRAADDQVQTVDWNQQTYADVGEIVCNAVSWSGSTDVGAHMDACAAIYDAFRLLIEGDQTLGGVVESAQMGRRRSWSPEQTPKGASVFLAFTVRVASHT
jgi:hypothetical protein